MNNITRRTSWLPEYRISG